MLVIRNICKSQSNYVKITKNDTRKIPDKAFTHGGTFHSDDVFSAALLKMLNQNIVIERGFQVPKNYDGLIFDIGGGEFDHHQIDNEIRENGVPYASFGKLWQAFGNRLVNEDSVRDIDEKLVQSIDLTDNTGQYNPLSMTISDMNPFWHDKNPDFNASFNAAVDMASIILSNNIEQARSREIAKNLAMQAYNNSECKEIIVLDEFIPAAPYLADTNAEFIIYPSNRGGYNVQTIPTTQDGTDSKIPLPESWAGKGIEAASVSDIDDMTFCHTGRWICATNTLEGAVKAAIVAICEEERYTEKMDVLFDKVMPNDDRIIEHVLGEE